MPNTASLLKAGIVRLARKEDRSSSAALRKAVTAHRSEIASLKKAVLALGAQVRKLSRPGGARKEEADSAEVQRFSAKGFAGHRKRLGLSAPELGALLGTSGQTIYNWEAGTSRPRDTHMQAIAKLRAMGKRSAQARLLELKGGKKARAAA